MDARLVTGEFSDSFIPIMDGVAIAVQNYAYWLGKTLGPTYVIAPYSPASTDRFDFEVLRYFSVPVPNRAPYRFGLPRVDPAFRLAIRDIPFDLVHAHCPFSSGHIALRIARDRAIPIIGTFHTKYRDNFEKILVANGLVEWCIKKIVEFYRSVDEVWVPNHSTGDTLREYGFEGPVEVVPNGTDMQLSDGERGTYRARADSELGTLPDEFCFLYVGQHVWEKNLGLLLRALSRVKHLGRSFKMFFVGEGYAGDELQALVEELELQDSVRFLGVIRDRERLKSLYIRADLYLLPSLYDNAPLTVREAAAVDLPTVLISGASAAEGIVDGVNGFLTSGSPEAYGDKLAYLMNHPLLVEKAGIGAGRSLCRSWEHILGEVRQRYIDMAQTHQQNLVFTGDPELDKASDSESSWT